MNYRKLFLGAVITYGVFSSQAVVASQAPMRPQADPSQAGASHHHPGGVHHHSGAGQEEHPGTHPGASHPGADQEEHKGKHPGTHSGTHSGTHPEAAHSGKNEPEKEITPVKQKLIDALKDHSLHCTAGEKNHPLTPAVIEEKATKVKKKGADFIVTPPKGPEVTCSK